MVQQRELVGMFSKASMGVLMLPSQRSVCLNGAGLKDKMATANDCIELTREYHDEWWLSW